MAINKNFVVKNGFEAGTSLIFADADTREVGIGTTNPQYTLHVSGGIGVTDAYVSGIGTFANELNVGLDGTVLTVLGLGNSIGVGTANPAFLLDVRSPVSTGQTALYVQGDVRITGDLSLDDVTLDDAEIQNLTVTEALNVTSPGISTFGGYVDINDSVDISSNLNVVGLSTLGGYVDINANADFSGTINVVGLSTLGGYVDINNSVDISNNLNVVGLTTLGGYVDINDSVDISTDLNVSGIATLATADINAGEIDVTRIGTSNLNVTGIATIATVDINGGDIEVSNVDTADLNVTGISTLGTVRISSGIITATSGIVTYYGDGQYLDLTNNPSTGIGIGTTGGVVGYAVTFIDFKGAGVSTTQYNSSTGIATIFFEGGGGGGSGSIGIGSTFSAGAANGDLFFHIDYGRIFVYYDEVTLGIGTDEFWIDAAPFNQGGLFVSKFGDNMFAGLGVTVGSLSSPSVYFNGYTNSGFYSPAANEFGVVVSGTQRLNVNSSGINVTGVATATTLSSTNLNVTNANITGVATATSFKGSAQVGVATGGTYIGLATQFNFVGSGVSVTHAYDATVGIATINLFVEASAGGGGGGDFNTGIASATAYAVTTGMATAYTAPATAGARHIVHSIHVTNIDGTTSADISGQLYAGAYSIANTIPVPAGSAVELLKQPKILSPSETIQLQSSATGDLHATITVETKAGDTTYIGVGTDITSAATYTDLHIATADTMLQSVLLANDDGAADVKANVVWTDGSNTIQGYYAFEMTIPADATVEILEKPKFLPNGFKVRVLANQANRLEAILSAKTI
jgi:hypothetical protein